jgi:hypothetical protein
MFDQPEEDSDEMEKIRRYFLIIDFLFEANRHRKQLKISLKEFHIDILNKEWIENLPDYYFDWYKAKRRIFTEYMEINEEYKVFEMDKRWDQFLYISFPWAFDASSKSKFLTFENHISRKKNVEGSIRSLFDIIEDNFFLQIFINRNSLIEDALNSLNRNPNEFKTLSKSNSKESLELMMEGYKRNFQLAVRDLFDVGYGMFDYNEDSHLFWLKKIHLNLQ